MLKNRHDFYLIFNNKIKRFDHVITRLRKPCSCDQRKRLSDMIQNQLFWWCWILLFYAPTSHILTFVGFGAAERCYYPITIGVFMLIKNLLNEKLLSIILILFALRTNQRCLDWSDDYSLSHSGAVIGSFKSKINLAGHLMVKDHDRALKLLEHVGEYHQNADLNYNLGLAYQIGGDMKKAMESYDKCLFYRQSHTYCRLNKAVILEKSQKSPVNELKKCINSKPKTQNEIQGHKLCQFNLGRFYVLQQNSKSIEILDSLSKNMEDLPKATKSSVYNLQAESQFQAGNFAEAEILAEQSIQTNSNHQAAYETASKAQLALGKTDKIDLTKMDPTRYAYVLNHVQNVDILKSICKPKITLLEACGERSRELGNLDLSLEYFHSVLKKDKNRFLTLTNLGGIYHLKNELDKAKMYYKAALKINPNNQLVKTNMARLSRTQL